MRSLPKGKITAVHAAPVFLNQDAPAKALALIEEAAGNGAELIVFPESFIPAFPHLDGVVGAYSRSRPVRGNG